MSDVSCVFLSTILFMQSTALFMSALVTALISSFSSAALNVTDEFFSLSGVMTMFRSEIII